MLCPPCLINAGTHSFTQCVYVCVCDLFLFFKLTVRTFSMDCTRKWFDLCNSICFKSINMVISPDNVSFITLGLWETALGLNYYCILKMVV